MHPDGSTSLLRRFCDHRGIREALSDADRHLLLSEYHKGYRAYIGAALAHNHSLGSIVLDEEPEALRCQPIGHDRDAGPEEPTLPYREVVYRHMSEIWAHGGLEEKTLHDKRDALSLLGQITDEKPIGKITTADARAVKDALLRLPMNRNKAPKTRGLPLSEMLKVPGVERIQGRTVNVYLGNLQIFFEWATDNGYAADYVFPGQRVKLTTPAPDELRRLNRAGFGGGSDS